MRIEVEELLRATSEAGSFLSVKPPRGYSGQGLGNRDDNSTAGR
jgi:hypothetical protein